MPPTETIPAELPRDLTPWGMFMSADVIVKAVMLGLVFASVLTWTIWFAKTLELLAARRGLARAQRTLTAARSLAEVIRPASIASPHVALLMQAAERELHRSPDLSDVDGIKERITARFERTEAGVGRKMMRATGILATVGATAPFIGLFGTGHHEQLHRHIEAAYDQSRRGRARHSRSAACDGVRAGGRYTGGGDLQHVCRSIANYRALFADASVEILTLVSRDLTQPAAARSNPFDPRRRPAAVPMAE
jgi:biopolymer transport protein ExbB